VTLLFVKYLPPLHQAAVPPMVAMVGEGDEAAVEAEGADEVGAEAVEVADATPADLAVKVLEGGFLMKIGKLCLNMRKRKSEMKEAITLPSVKLVN
jgi:hypothetical protein